jgi:hypothetical protein
MAVVGDRVQVPSKRVGQTPREGIVTGVSGALLRVAWSSGEESTIMPSMGSLVVVGRAKGASAGPRPRQAKPPAKRSAARTESDRSPPRTATKAAKSPTRKSGKPSSRKAAKAPARKAGNALTKKAKAPAKNAGKALAKKAKRAKDSARKANPPSRTGKASKSSSKRAGRTHKRPR